MTIIDKKNNTESNLRENLSDVVIMVNMIYAFIPLVFLAYKLFETVKYTKHYILKNRKRKKVVSMNDMPKLNHFNSEPSFQNFNDQKEFHEDSQDDLNKNNLSRSDFIPSAKIKENLSPINYHESEIISEEEQMDTKM